MDIEKTQLGPSVLLNDPNIVDLVNENTITMITTPIKTNGQLEYKKTGFLINGSKKLNMQHVDCVKEFVERGRAGMFPIAQPDVVLCIPSTNYLNISPAFYAPCVDELTPSGTLSKNVDNSGTPTPLLLSPSEIPCGESTAVTKNRVIVSPMCMYSCNDGFPAPFHLVHYGQFALHGAGTIVVEASAVSPEGRISPRDMGIYKEEHVAAHASLVSTVKSTAADVRIGIQIAHAGRKASTWPPYMTREAKSQPYVPSSEGGWSANVLGPSPIPFAEGHIVPKEMTLEDIRKAEDDFVRAADRAFRAGYDFVQVHSAHGYLLSSFNSPLTNKRKDMYGGSFENRTRLLRNIVRRIRAQFPNKGVWVRINGTDGLEDSDEPSWTYESTQMIAPVLEQEGVDLLDVSSRGTISSAKVEMSAGYQLPGAVLVKSLGLERMLVSAVGSLHGGTEENPTLLGKFAEHILQNGNVDFVCLGRIFLHNPTWVRDVARNLTGTDAVSALQYDYTLPSLRSMT